LPKAADTTPDKEKDPAHFPDAPGLKLGKLSEPERVQGRGEEEGALHAVPVIGESPATSGDAPFVSCTTWLMH